MNGSVVCTNVTLIDNQAFEKDEYFTVLVSAEPNVAIHDNFILHILDDDRKGYSLGFPLANLS